MAIGTLPPELFEQQQALNRQQQMAQALMQQGQQQPQGQMVSGRYVAPSFFQNVLPLAQMYAGTRMAEQGDKRALDLAAALRKQYGDELSQYQNLMNPRQTEMAGPTPTGAPLMTQNVPDRQAANLFAASAYNPALQAVGMKNLTQGPKWEKVDRLDQRGNTVTGMIDVNSSQPETTFREIGVSKPAISVAESARLNFEGIPVGGGASSPANAMPQSNVPNANMGQTNTAIQTIPTQGGANPAVNMAGLSPKQTQELRGKVAEDYQKNFKNAQDALPVIKEAELLLPKSSSGGIQAGFTFLTKQAGISTDMSKADAQLKILGAKLTAQVPRFEGPQSNVDVQAYREAAGAIADPTIPYADRMAALNTVKQLQAKYAPDLYAKEFPNMTNIGASQQSYKTETEANDAFKQGKIKRGDRVVINGVSGTWR
jgi:hypothetical protein